MAHPSRSNCNQFNATDKELNLKRGSFKKEVYKKIELDRVYLKEIRQSSQKIKSARTAKFSGEKATEFFLPETFAREIHEKKNYGNYSQNIKITREPGQQEKNKTKDSWDFSQAKGNQGTCG